MTTTLVIGAHGTVGSALVPLLQQQGQAVRRATSRPTGSVAGAAGGDVRLNLLTQEGLSQAFDGVDAAFLLCPPGHTNQHELLGPVIEEARSRRLAKVVLMSAMGANADPQAPLRLAERQLEASGLPYTIVRPNWFMQNFHTFWLEGIRRDGVIALPVGTARGSFIDARDIAAAAAVLLDPARGHAWDGQDLDLTGGEALNHDEVAALLSRETGRAIRFADIAPEALRPGLLAAGLPADYADFLLLILGFFKAGYAERITDAVPTLTGRAPTPFTQYAKDYRAAWLG